jgi:hypothetical protein
MTRLYYSFYSLCSLFNMFALVSTLNTPTNFSLPCLFISVCFDVHTQYNKHSSLFCVPFFYVITMGYISHPSISHPSKHTSTLLHSSHVFYGVYITHTKHLTLFNSFPLCLLWYTHYPSNTTLHFSLFIFYVFVLVFTHTHTQFSILCLFMLIVVFYVFPTTHMFHFSPPLQPPWIVYTQEWDAAKTPCFEALYVCLVHTHTLPFTVCIPTHIQTHNQLHQLHHNTPYTMEMGETH